MPPAAAKQAAAEGRIRENPDPVNPGIENQDPEKTNLKRVNASVDYFDRLLSDKKE